MNWIIIITLFTCLNIIPGRREGGLTLQYKYWKLDTELRCVVISMILSVILRPGPQHLLERKLLWTRWTREDMYPYTQTVTSFAKYFQFIIIVLSYKCFLLINMQIQYFLEILFSYLNMSNSYHNQNSWTHAGSWIIEYGNADWKNNLY